MKKTSPYGALLRKRRVEAGLSLREVAGTLGVSHVFLADVERGVRPLSADREPALLTALTNLTQAELDDARALSRPIKITLSNTPDRYVDLTIALARRFEREDLSDTKVNRILAILKEDEED
jgi:transcriptional regulator with XRE-family HTH domain